MKKIILIFALFMGVFAAQAQSLQENKFFDNMSVTLKGGAIMPFQGYAFWPSARGVFGLELRKQITPVIGFGLEGEATINTTSWEKTPNYWGPKSPNIIDHTLAGLFGTVNLGNLFMGYAGKPRFFELEAVFGAGWLHAFHRAGESAHVYGNDYDSWYTKAGANLNFNFGEARAFTFSLKPAVVWDMNGDIMQAYRHCSNVKTIEGPHSNLSNLFMGYKGMPRVFEVEGVIGAGWLHAFHRAEAATMYGNDYDSWYTKAGANLNFNFGESRAWTFSLKPSVVWDMNGDIMQIYRNNERFRGEWNVDGHVPHNGKSQMSASHAAVELEAGITYHFKGSNGERYITFCPYKYSQNDIDALNNDINGLRSQLNGLKGDLDAANARNAQLQRDLDAARKAPKPEAIDKTKYVERDAMYMNVLVHFKVNKTNITPDQQANVERVAMYLKNNPNATVDIKGYASVEGPADNNVRLANGRAEAVKNMLINKYKIEPNRINAQGCGTTDMFQELSWNRVSICELIVKK